MQRIKMTIALDEILLPLPSQPRETEVDWASAQSAIRTALPDDYKEFIRRYGTGKVDGFLWVMNPIAANPRLNLISRGGEMLRACREYRSTVAVLGKVVPFAAFPEPGGILPWGFTENGDACYWRTGNADPNMWPVVVNDGRGSMWEQFRGSMTEFIAAVLSRRYKSDILSDDEFPSQNVSFEPR